MTNLTEIKQFAIDNPPKSEIGFDHNGIWIVNPWYDPSYRYYLTDEEAVAEYGFENMLKFIELAEKSMERGDNTQAKISAQKQTFIVDIEETLVSGFAVEAYSMDEAMEIAERKYFDGEFVLGGDADVAFRQMRASTEDFTETTEWTEF